MSLGKTLPECRTREDVLKWLLCHRQWNAALTRMEEIGFERGVRANIHPIDAPEPKGPRGSWRLSIRGASRHNKGVADTLDEGTLYRVYDHYRKAFWGPNQEGYFFRKGAGVYTVDEVRQI